MHSAVQDSSLSAGKSEFAALLSGAAGGGGGRCPECATNDQCSGDTPHCDADATPRVCTACPAATPEWDGNSKRCMSCYDADNEKPFWNDGKKRCESCDNSTPFWDGTTCKSCADHNSTTPMWHGNPKRCMSCYDKNKHKPFWDGITCKACNDSTPFWDGNTCKSCGEYDSATPKWH